MKNTRRRVTILCIGLLAMTLISHVPVTTSILDWSFGIEWSKNIVDFLNKNTQGMIILVGLTLWLEYVGLGRSRDSERNRSEALEQLLERTLKSTPDLSLLSHSIESMFGKNAATCLVRHFTQPLLEADVSLTAKPGKDFNGYSIAVEVSYTTHKSGFLIAVTDSPMLAEGLIALSLFDEVPVVNKGTLPQFNKKPPVAVEIYSTGKGGFQSREALDFVMLQPKELKSLLGARGENFLTASFFVFQASRKGAPLQKDSRYLVKYDFKSPHIEPFMYWMTDRPIQIRKIEVDVSNLKSVERDQTRIQFFIGSTDWMADQGAAWNTPTAWDDRRTFPVNTWLLRGQGLYVSWFSLTSKVTELEKPENGQDIPSHTQLG